MEKNRDIKEYRAVPIADVASRLGLDVEYDLPKNIMAFAPWRYERTASVAINKVSNCWTDFGDRKYHGNVIDLIMNVRECDFVSALDWLDREFFDGANTLPGPVTPVHKPVTRISRHQVISGRRCLRALSEIGVPLEVAKRYCEEVAYVNDRHGKTGYGVGLPNVNGGYVILNGSGYYTVGNPGVSYVPGDTDGRCLLFLDMVKFLAVSSYFRSIRNGIAHYGSVILNGETSLGSAVEYLRRYAFVDCIVDPEDDYRWLYQALWEAGLDHRFLAFTKP